MQKINGYTEDEARELIEFVEEGKRSGKTLTALFAAFGERHGRARGSVRNYYYALMKNEQSDERIVKLLDGRRLSVGKIRAFTEEEADEAIRSILLEKAKGLSVRKAIFQLSGGDDKLMLRLQNKYRNTLKKEPERIAAIERELFGEERTKSKKGRGVYELNDGLTPILKGEEARQMMQKRLEKEINALYDRLTKALKEENARLAEENSLLRAELERLRKKLH
jgi:hypothetical protein